MKRIINGKRYDTETATEVATWGHGYRGDFDEVTETLYRTKSGAWFLHGEGGPNTRWRQTVGQNEWSGGEGIEPLTETEAREWLEAHGKTAELEEYFSGAIVDA
jgi:hypothetical protein